VRPDRKNKAATHADAASLAFDASFRAFLLVALFIYLNEFSAPPWRRQK
jgi:hypothetical protein